VFLLIEQGVVVIYDANTARLPEEILNKIMQIILHITI
jgi:hypothetical protein